eukprot:4122687-Pyramimonas_sp.AAC.1
MMNAKNGSWVEKMGYQLGSGHGVLGLLEQSGRICRLTVAGITLALQLTKPNPSRGFQPTH